MEVKKKNDSNHSSNHTTEIIFEAKIIRDERNNNVITCIYIYIYLNHREKYLEKSLYIRRYNKEGLLKNCSSKRKKRWQTKWNRGGGEIDI